MYTEFGYITGPDVNGAKWLSQNNNAKNLVVYADLSCAYTLVSYGGIYVDNIFALTNETYTTRGELVYLGELVTVYGEVGTWNSSTVLGSQPLSLTYNNGYCQIYKNTISAP